MKRRIIKAIEMKDTNTGALTQVINDLKDEGIQVIKLGERSLFSIEDSSETEAFIESIEDNAFELGLAHSKGVLIYFDTEKSKAAPAKKLMKLYGEVEEISDSENGVSIANIPDLIELIDDRKNDVDEEIEELFPQESATNEKIEESDGFDQDFDSMIDEIFNDDKELLVGTDTEHYKEDEEDPVVEEVTEGVKLETNDNKKNEVESIEFRKEIATDDYLLEKAKSLFEAEAPLKLPKFDEVTNKEMQEQFISAQMEIERARAQGINKIYNRLKEENNESMQTIETHLLVDARKNHNRTVEIIVENFKADAQKLIADNNEAYEKEREQFVHAQIPALKKQYDALNYTNNEIMLDNLLTKLNNQKVTKIMEENKQYQNYLNQIFDEGEEKMLGSLEIDDVIAEYNVIAEEQLQQLKTYAKGLKGQIGETITKLLKERKNYKDEITSIQNEKNQLENKLMNQIEISEKQSNEKLKEVLEEKENAEKQADKKIKEAESESNEMLIKIKELEDALKKSEDSNVQKTVVKEKLIPVNDYEISNNKEVQDQVTEQTNKYSWLKKIVYPYLLGTCAVATMVVSGVVLNGIRTEMKERNDLEKTVFVSQLEINEKYDKAADTMKEFGATSEEIAKMYIDNNKFYEAVEENADSLPAVLTAIDKYSDDKKADMTKLKEIKGLSKAQVASIDTRLAILDNNLSDLEVAAVQVKDDKDTINLAVAYFIQEKDFSEAESLLEKNPNKELSKELSEAKKKNEESIKKNISEIEDEISEINKKNDDLNKQIDTLKSGKDKDKDKKVSDKEKEIQTNKTKKEELNKKLESEKEKLES